MQHEAYRFQALPTDAELLSLRASGCLDAGVAVSVRPFMLELGVYNVLGIAPCVREVRADGGPGGGGAPGPGGGGGGGAGVGAAPGSAIVLAAPLAGMAPVGAAAVSEAFGVAAGPYV